jgi:hypothetical protein
MANRLTEQVRLLRLLRLDPDQRERQRAPPRQAWIGGAILLVLALAAGAAAFVVLRSERFEIEKAYQRLLPGLTDRSHQV